MSRHECYADACKKQIPDGMLMCRRHWDMVSKEIQRDVYRMYRTAFGTEEYFNAINAARECVRSSVTGHRQ